MSYEEHQQGLADAISKVADGGMVTHYVVVAAVVAEDGDSQVHSIVSPGLPYWMRHGLLSAEASATAPQPYWTIGEGD